MKKRLLYLLYSLLFFLPTQLLAQMASHVVISEIYGGGGGSSASLYANDFVELYNPTSADIDISNWSVQFAIATGTTFTDKTIIPAGKIIKSHGYFLIQESTGLTPSAALPTPDVTGTASIAAGSAQIALINNSTVPTTVAATGSTIVDFVGFGTAVNYEGSGPAQGPTNSTSIERKTFATSTKTTMAAGGADDLQGNGYDSDNNAIDFVVDKVVNPQNSSSPIEPAATVPATPTLVTSTTSLDFGATQLIGSAIVKTFTVSSSNLTADAAVSTTAPFLVSKDNITFTASVSFTAAELIVMPSPTVYVQFTPTDTNPVTDNVTIVSTGAASQTIALTGTGAAIAIPALTTSVTSLDFGAFQVVGLPASKSFTVSSSSLTTDATVLTAAPFLVSKDNTTFTPSVSFTAAELAAITSPAVYVQFTPIDTNPVTGSVTLSSTGISQTVTLTGIGSPTIANHVVISEIYGGGGSATSIYANDFIELYNPTSANVDISNWSVQSAAATATAFTTANQTIIPPGSIIKSHGYFLIQEANGTTASTPLPAPDLAGTVSIAAGSGQVALVNNSTLLANIAATGTGIVDFVGYGTTALHYEGTGPATAPSNATSIERKAFATSTAITMAAGGTDNLKGNGYDNDDNTNDFFVPAVINPQNSSSPIEPVPTDPVLSTSVATLDFGNRQVVSTSVAKSFMVSGINLTADAMISTAAPFLVSRDNVTFAASVSYTAAELMATPSPVVYVQFTPADMSQVTGIVTVASTGAVSQLISLAGTGTSADAPAGANHIVISEIYGGGGANANSPFSNDFVELYNPTNTNVDISNWSVQIGSATATTFISANQTIIPPGSTIKSHGYFLIQESMGATPTAGLPVPDVTGTVSIAAGSGQVALVNNATLLTTIAATSTSIVDFVGYGTTAVNYEGAAPSLSPSNTISIERKAFSNSTAATMTAGGADDLQGNGYDTDNNGNDFFVAATVNPQNSSSPIEPIPTGPALTTSITSLDFGIRQVVGSPVSKSFTVSGVNLTTGTTVSTAAPFLVSRDNVTFTASVSYTAAELMATPGPAVYVQFTPADGNPATGNVTVTSGNAISQTVTLTGTGALANAPAGANHVVISEIFGGGGANANSPYSNDFIELYNPTSMDVDISNWSVQCTSATGTSFAVAGQTIIPAGTTIRSHGYFLIQESTGATASPALPTPDLTGSVSIAAGSGQVALVNNSDLLATITATGATIVDFVGYGTTAVNYEGTAPAPAPSNTISIERKAFATSTATTMAAGGIDDLQGNGYDTDNNGSDFFAVKVVNPQNSLSPVEPIYTGPFNKAPTLNVITDQITCATTIQQSIDLSGITPGPETDQSTSVFVSSSDPAIQLSVSPVSSTGTSQILYTLTNNAGSAGTITVTVKDNGGTANGGIDIFTRTFNITVNSLPVVSIASDKGLSITKGETAILTATGGVQYSWAASDDITGPTNTAAIAIQPQKTTVYTVTATKASGCATVQTITITVNTAPLAIIANNIITPNGDGKNDTWVVKNIDQYPGNTVKVFDKLGKMVFSKTGYQGDWNGYYNSVPLPQGTYYYVIDLGDSKSYKGYISVVRD